MFPVDYETSINKELRDSRIKKLVLYKRLLIGVCFIFLFLEILYYAYSQCSTEALKTVIFITLLGMYIINIHIDREYSILAYLNYLEHIEKNYSVKT